MGPKTFEMEMHANVLSNFAWSRLTELMEGDLGQSTPAEADISEAELMLQFKRAVAQKADFVLIRLRHND